MQSTAPILKSFLHPAAIESALMTFYRFNDPDAHLMQGTMRDVYHVRHREGEAVAIVYPYTRDPAAINAEAHLIRRICDAGFPTAAPIPSRAGSLTARIPAPEGDRLMLVTEFLYGEWERQPDEANAERIGELLRHFHTLTNEMKMDRPAYTTQVLVHSAYDLVREFIYWDQEYTTWLGIIVDTVAPRLDHLLADAPDMHLVHGDVIPSNIMNSGEQHYLLDFDLIGYGPRRYDAASFLNELAYWSGDQGDTRVERAFLRGFGDESLLEDPDVIALRIARIVYTQGIAASHIGLWGRRYLSQRILSAAREDIHRLLQQL